MSLAGTTSMGPCKRGTRCRGQEDTSLGHKYGRRSSTTQSRTIRLVYSLLLACRLTTQVLPSTPWRRNEPRVRTSQGAGWPIYVHLIHAPRKGCTPSGRRRRGLSLLLLGSNKITPPAALVREHRLGGSRLPSLVSADYAGLQGDGWMDGSVDVELARSMIT